MIRWGPELASEAFRELRSTLELAHCKWDAQVGDETALAPAPLLLRGDDWSALRALAEQLFAETVAIENELLERPGLHDELGLPRALRRLLRATRAAPSAARVMRFDFHWTSDGWRISEVNSDVPGGYSEATHLPRLMAAHMPGATVAGDPTVAVTTALARAAAGRLVAFTCAPGFMEDQQVVAYLATALRQRGQTAELASVGQLRWVQGRARLQGAKHGQLGAIFRFYQAEWLAAEPGRSWQELFTGFTPVTNPLAAVLSESKRLPLIWDRLRTRVPVWRQLLPETRELRAAPWARDDGWLIKSAYCNTGDTVSIRSAMTPRAFRGRAWRARLQPGRWLAQRRFDVVPIGDARGVAWFPCLGVYVVDGETCGVYARVTRGALIDFSAKDAALLIYDGA